MRIFSGFAVAGVLFAVPLCRAQHTPYVGVIGGVSTLSADAATALNSSTPSSSSYKPENGPAAGAFAGIHWNDYLSFQADYFWNRNAVTLSALQASSTGALFFEQRSQSNQNTVLGNALLFFRARSSWARPYLSVGGGVVHMLAEPEPAGLTKGFIAPGAFSAVKPALQVAVGIDVKLKNRWIFRYSFAETMSPNPISDRLTPPGTRMLANFRNLFGIAKSF